MKLHLKILIGYILLTIKDYDEYTNSYLLDFPNNEVRQGFLSLLLSPAG